MSRSTTGSLPDIFARALAALRQGSRPALAIAYSGGLDSSVLLHLAHSWASAHDVALFAFHVHHGLSPNADAWLAHCRAQCKALNVRFDASHVTLQKNKSGIEAAARKLRYAALGALCGRHGVELMLTAHHLNDQAETVLLQLLRGSGMAGLSGMDGANSAPELLGNAALVMARPLLPVIREALEAYAGVHGISWIDDESNSDPRYARNALRLQVMPALAAAFPGFQERFARSAAHAQSAQRLLAELAENDLRAVLVDGTIEVAPLRLLTLDRVRNLLRYWFSLKQVRMPSAAWLDEMVSQLLEARPGSQMLVSHPDCHIRRHRDRLYIVDKLDELAGMRDPDDDGVIVRHAERFVWQGEASLDFPDYGGTLHFDSATRGFDPAWLRVQRLHIDFRVGGERIKLAHNRPTRSLKYHYQAVNVPAWERTRLPVVGAGKSVLYAAGIGMDYHHLVEGEGSVALRWETADLAT
ncbi:tRNA lysidine(34) synthetase TilS [Massilia sp. PWRC2]|uniref:tRNA lysidine(34) synthetase TilS n=1 Tax=Massilia sp. PWRC2 TaxID=2804626 RepID=UPI003CEDCD5D